MDVDTLFLAAGAIIFMGMIPFSYPAVFSNEAATVILGVTVVVIMLSTVLASIGAFYMEMHTKRCVRAESNGERL
ncbi:MAG: hypothetical protein MIO90_01510 [Methanomassiliicoccales archaeon]|nr:hypothetical protein [Methanomassiliicoccales archaeon]